MNKKRTLNFGILSLFLIVALALSAINLFQRQPAQASFESTQTPDASTPLWVVRVYTTDREVINRLAEWSEPWQVNREEGYILLGIPPSQYSRLTAMGLRLEIDEALTEQVNQRNSPLPDQISGIPGYPCYRTVEETYETAEQIVADHPQLASWIDIGDSWDKLHTVGKGYDLMVLRLTNQQVPGPKPQIFIMSSIHAREYTPAELNTRFAEYMVENFGIDADVTWLLDYNEFHLLLHANPDGRKIAETGESWRKNVDNDDGCTISSLWGVDLNRNFSFHWGEAGASTYACDSTYRGPSAASEPETQAVQAYIGSIFPDQRGPNDNDPAPTDAQGVFLDIHSYSNLVLWPWGYSATVPPNAIALQTLGRKLAYFNNYQPEQAYDLYVTSGSTEDYVYGEFGVAAYSFELGNAFFESCSNFENTVLPDNMPALIYFAKSARTPYLSPSGPDVYDLAISPASAVQGDIVSLAATLDDTRYNNTNGSEPVQKINAAVYSIDRPDWIDGVITFQMNPLDGNFDSSIESASAYIDTADLDPGRHILFARGQDADGNWGPPSAQFFEVTGSEPTEHKIFLALIRKGN